MADIAEKAQQQQEGQRTFWTFSSSLARKRVAEV